MKKYFSKRTIILIICSIVIIIALSASKSTLVPISTNEITKLTDAWIKEVTVNRNPDAISKLFCSDGNLVGTVSQVKRRGQDIKKYFDYFAKLPGIQVINKKYNISKITSNVYLNTAFITWSWDGLEEPITARMTFIFRDKCIFQLHSSALPDLNKDLLKISQVA
jgi:hypothetical protein